MKVRDVMTKDVLTTSPEATLKEVAALLAEHGISGLPVVDEQRRVLGVVSEADILLRERTAEGERGGLIGRLLGQGDELERKLAARTAGEAMTSPAVVIDADRVLGEAAARMLDEGVNRLPVLEGGKLVGNVTRADLVRAFVRTDEEIADEIREDVLRRTLWISPDDLELRVERGEVIVEGRLDTKTEAELVEAFAARVPGVLSVRSLLSWKEDDR
jgi:CBS domain-containing protein